jgi:hypothetical protein
MRDGTAAIPASEKIEFFTNFSRRLENLLYSLCSPLISFIDEIPWNISSNRVATSAAADLEFLVVFWINTRKKKTGITSSGAPKRAIKAQIGSIDIATITRENTAIRSRNDPARTVAHTRSIAAVSPLTRSINDPGEFF